MAEFRGVKKLEEKLKDGCEIVKDVENKLDSLALARDPDFLDFIWNRSVEIISTFGSILGMIRPDSNPCRDDHCQGIENPLKKNSAAIKMRQSQRNSFKDNRKSCSPCRRRSFSYPRSPGQSSLGCSRLNDMSEGFVHRSSSSSGKLKCDKLGFSPENMCTCKRKKQAISRKRKATEEWTQLVVQQSPETGNLPQSDGFTWQRYGIKAIAGAEHPRVYYKCTYPGCIARKRTQRSSVHPSLFDVWLSGDHTCQQNNRFDPHPLSEIRSSNTNPNLVTPTSLIVGADSNIQPNIFSAGNTTYAGNFVIPSSPTPWPASDDVGLQEQIQGFTDFENCLSGSLYGDSSAHSPMQFTCPPADQGYNNLQGS